jgi:hypothetical protein
MKPHSFAMALNYRKTPGTGTFGWEVIHNLTQFVFRDGWSSPILLRYTLEHEKDFNGAQDRLEKTQLIAPSYLILAGIHQDEGVVIERGRDSKHTRNFSDPYENAKFLVQTNHDIPKPANQDENWAGDDLLLNESKGMGTVSRRESAKEFLEAIDENNLDAELMVMLGNHWPVFNSWTIFSSLLSPANNEMTWIVQEPNK